MFIPSWEMRRGSAGAPHRSYRRMRNIVRPHKHLTGGVRLQARRACSPSGLQQECASSFSLLGKEGDTGRQPWARADRQSTDLTCSRSPITELTAFSSLCRLSRTETTVAARLSWTLLLGEPTLWEPQLPLRPDTCIQFRDPSIRLPRLWCFVAHCPARRPREPCLCIVLCCSGWSPTHRADWKCYFSCTFACGLLFHRFL